MSVLSDLHLCAAIREGRLVVAPLGSNAIQPNSVDLRLGPVVLIATPDGYRRHHLADDGPLRLGIGMFVLGSTLERVELDDTLCAFVNGKSSRAREGIQIHAAGLVDAGWRGELTLEIQMMAPLPGVWLMHGMQIAQLHVEPLTARCERPYGSDGLGSRYQDSAGPIESRATIGRPS
jgi:dCTP deaminase